MTALSSLAILVCLSAPADSVLVQFSSQNCPHCRAMEPALNRLAQAGCAVQVIDVDQHSDVAQQFHITDVPTFVALTAGREIGRIVGAASYERLAELAEGSGFRVQGSGGGRPPATHHAPRTTHPVGTEQPGARGQGLQATDYRANELGAASAVGGADALQAAVAATVRLKVEDATGYGFGTGTIIDTHEDEALVVTCGHLFRESQGKGRITVELFTSGQPQAAAGQLIAYDLDRDVALISLRTPLPVRPVPVAPPSHAVRPGDAAFTIGCDKGASPSVRQTQITAVNKYIGRPNYTAAGQPVDGRSGGGLFTADGLLIGVCNAADPADDEGLYAGMASIHWQLDQIGQSEIYQRAARAALATAMPSDREIAPAATPAPLNELAALPQLPPQMPAAPLVPAQPLSDEIAPVVSGEDAEIVFIVRSKRDPAQRSEVFVVDQAPPDLIARITHAARASGQRRAAQTHVPASGAPPSPPAADSTGGVTPVVRGQSN